MRVYLAGSINGCTDAEAMDWRRTARIALGAHGIECVDPMRRDYRGHEDENVSAIVNGDLADIATCDLMLAYCWQPSYGTAMEIRYAAKELGMSVYAVVPDGPVSPWLRYHATIFASLKDATMTIARLQVEAAS